MIFKNKNINQLNIHAALLVLSQNLVQVFGAIFFLQRGFDPSIVLGGWALIYFFRLILRPLAYKFIRFIGIREAAILGTLLYSCISIFLPMVNYPNWLFVGFLLYYAICELIYWFAYHTYFSILSDGFHRGREVCARESLMMLAGAFAPALGGILIQYIGFLFAGIIAACLTLVAAIPLLYLPDVKIGSKVKMRTVIKNVGGFGFKLWFGWAIMFYMFSFVWSIILFYLVGSYSLFGGMLTLEILFSVMILNLVGNLIDRGAHMKVLKISVTMIAFVVFLRVFVVNSLSLVIVAQFLSALSMAIFRPILITSFYSRLKQSKNQLGFALFAEWGWDVGAVVSLSTAAVLYYSGFPFVYLMLISIVGLLMCYYMLSNNIKDGSMQYNFSSLTYKIKSIFIHHK